MLWQLALDEVRLVPCRRSPHKAAPPAFADEARLAMLEAAIADHAGLAVSSLELDRPAPSFTVDTLEEIVAAEPAASLWLVIGADQLLALRSWERVERIVELARLAVARRDDEAASGLRAAARDIGADRIDWIAMPRVELSSSMLRERLSRGLPVDHLMPSGAAAVARAAVPS